MKHARSIPALLLTCVLLVLSSGGASAKITESDDPGTGSGSSYDRYSVPAVETERDAALLRHWGLDPQGFGTAAGGAGDTDVGAARNDIGPAAPAEPETTPVTTGVDGDQVIGWSAAGLALLAALIAGALFLRRRHDHLVSHA